MDFRSPAASTTLMFGNPDGSRALGITTLSSSQKRELEREFRRDSRLGTWGKGELAERIGGSRDDIPLIHLWFTVRRLVERCHAPKGLLSRRDDAIRVLRNLVRTPETIRELDLQLLYERLVKDLVHPSTNQNSKTASGSPTQSVFSTAWSKLGAKPASKPTRSTSRAHDLAVTRFNLSRLSRPRRVSSGIIHVHNSVIKSIPNDLPQTVLPPDTKQEQRKASFKADANVPSLAEMMKADIKDVRKTSSDNTSPILPAKEGDELYSVQQFQHHRNSTDLSIATTINAPELESMYHFQKKSRRRSPHLHEIVSRHAAQKAMPEVQVASAILPPQPQVQPLIIGSDLPPPLQKLHLERMASMTNHMEHALKRDRRTGDQKSQRLSIDIPGVSGERRKSIEKVHDWMANNAGDESVPLGGSTIKQEPTRHYSIHSNMSSRTLTDSTRGSIFFDEGYHSRGSWSTDYGMPLSEAVLAMLQKPTHPLATSEIPSPLEKTEPKHIFNTKKDKSFNFIVPVMQSPQLNHLNSCDKAESEGDLTEKLRQLPPLDLDSSRAELRKQKHDCMLSPKSPAPARSSWGGDDNSEGHDDDERSGSTESETPDGSIYSLWSENSYDGVDPTAYLSQDVLDKLTETFMKSFSAYKLRNSIQSCQLTPSSSSPGPTQSQQNGKTGKKGCGRKANERKRKRGNDEDGDQDERRRRLDSHRSESEAEDGRNEKSFACPYCKWKPVTYSSCRIRVLKEISRVKQHLFRKHVAPIHCVHCYAQFKTSELRDEHLLERSCTTLPRRNMECMTEEMRDRIKRRVDPKKTKSEQWYDIYAILFPDHPLPDNPFLDEVISTELNALEAFTRDEWPRLADTIIREHLPEPLRNQEHLLRSFLPYLIEQGFHNLLLRFEQQRGPRPDAPQTRSLNAGHSPSVGASDSGVSITPPQGSFNRFDEPWSMNLQTPSVSTPTNSTGTANWPSYRSFADHMQARSGASSLHPSLALPWQSGSQNGPQNVNTPHMGGSSTNDAWVVPEQTMTGVGIGHGGFSEMSMTDFPDFSQQGLDIVNQRTGVLPVNMDEGAPNFEHGFDSSQGQGVASGNGTGDAGFGQQGFGSGPQEQ